MVSGTEGVTHADEGESRNEGVEHSGTSERTRNSSNNLQDLLGLSTTFSSPSSNCHFFKLSLSKSLQSAPVLLTLEAERQIKREWGLCFKEESEYDSLCSRLQDYERHTVARDVLLDCGALDMLITKLTPSRVLVPPPPQVEPRSPRPGNAVAMLRLQKLDLSKTRRTGDTNLEFNEDAIKALGMLLPLLFCPHGTLLCGESASKALELILEYYTHDRISVQNTSLVSHRFIKMITPIEPSEESRRIGAGRHGSVHELQCDPKTVIKRISLESSQIGESLRKIYSEVTCLEILSQAQYETNRPQVVPLKGYGMHSENREALLLMEKATCSLTNWREKQSRIDAKRFVLNCLCALEAIADSIDYIGKHGVVHYDIRCDNILVLTEEDGSEQFVLGDFGESHFCKQAGEFQFKSRGTECIKSPEMLTVCTHSSAQNRGAFDRRRVFEYGTSAPSDIWSFGCLVFELLTSEYLYEESADNWSTFFTRLTKHTQVGLQIVPELKQSLLEQVLGDDLGAVVKTQLLDYILIPDPRYRPTAKNVVFRIQDLAASLQKNEQ